MGSPSAAVGAGSPPVARWWAVTGVAVAGVGLSVTDSGVLSIALPAVRGDLAVPADEAAWIGTAFLLCQALLIPAGAWLAERWGLRRTQLIALALFAALSLLVSSAWDPDSVLVFRTLQAVPGALVPVVSTALLCRLVPPRRRRMALTGYGLCIVVASGLTPLVGGYLLDHGHTWRAIFFAEALDDTLRAITARYGTRTTDFVAMQLEYPRNRATP